MPVDDAGRVLLVRYVGLLADTARPGGGEDPTFVTTSSLDAPPSWLLEATRAGVAIWFDPAGVLGARLTELRSAIEGGTYCRKLFMGLPYDARVAP